MTAGTIRGLALASLSGESDAEWALRRQEWIDVAFLGGLALDETTREAARAMVERGRDEFLTFEPFAWIREQFGKLEGSGVRPAVNVRASSPQPLEEAARAVSEFDGILEINAHCRQPEMIEAGSGHALLRDSGRLWEYLEAAQGCGVDVSLKARFEVPGVDSVSLLNRAAENGLTYLHVDTMDSESLLRNVTGATVIANNGVREPKDLETMAGYGAGMVSVARGDRPEILSILRDHIPCSGSLEERPRTPGRPPLS